MVSVVPQGGKGPSIQRKEGWVSTRAVTNALKGLLSVPRMKLILCMPSPQPTHYSHCYPIIHKYHAHGSMAHALSTPHIQMRSDWAGWWITNALPLVSGRCRVWILARWLLVLQFCGFPQPLQANSGIIPWLRHNHFISLAAVHNSTIILLNTNMS